jgi:leucyl aminopeptidase (aminopeptidase T)
MLNGLRWEFKNGHLVNYSAMMNFESFKGLYEGASGDKDRIADIAIGLNPNAQLVGFFTDRFVQGTVSIGIGGNNGIGGDNKNIFGNEGTLRKLTLEVDGYKLVSDGKISG